MLKKILAVVGLLTLAALADSPRPRFALLLTETAPFDETVRHFSVWHDRESGQEFTCASGWGTGGIQQNYSMSCWPTGRNWK